MPRKSLIRSDELFYHVTLRCNNKEWFDLPLELVWKSFLSCVRRANEIHPVEIHFFIIMKNHYHMLLRTPNADLNRFMFELNGRFSRKLRGYTGRINRVFGDRYKWSLIMDQKYYLNVLRYVCQNPRRAGIVCHCEDYPFSTLFLMLRNTEHMACVCRENLPHKIDEQFLKWINSRIEKNEEQGLSEGLAKKIFKFPVIRTSRGKICEC